MNVWIIAQVSRSIPGGMRRHMELHAEGLCRLGEQATLFFEEELGDGLARHVSPRAPGLRSLSALRERLRREPPDVVNVHTQCAPAWIMAKMSGLLRARVVVMSYAADEGGLRVEAPRDVLRWLRIAVPARTTFPFADGIWCVNQTDLAYYRDRYGVPAHKLVCLPHAVGDEFYGDGENEPRDARQLLFVGSWIQRKGVDVLVAALEQVVERAPDTKIVLAGTLVEDAELARRLPPKLLPHTRTFCTIGDRELARLYRQSSLLLLPSRREGLPIVMLEAMACGCPTLAAANSGMLDVIVPGKNGWLESSFDPARWAERCLALLAAPDLVRAVSREAVETARRFRIEAVATASRDWYRALRSSRPHGASGRAGLGAAAMRECDRWRD